MYAIGRASTTFWEPRPVFGNDAAALVTFEMRARSRKQLLEHHGADVVACRPSTCLRGCPAPPRSSDRSRPPSARGRTSPSLVEDPVAAALSALSLSSPGGGCSPSAAPSGASSPSSAASGSSPSASGSSPSSGLFGLGTGCGLHGLELLLGYRGRDGRDGRLGVVEDLELGAGLRGRTTLSESPMFRADTSASIDSGTFGGKTSDVKSE